MATELEKIADAQRKIAVARNEYDNDGKYGSTNKNALSDGDNKGKGDVDGSVGSKTDINTRTSNTVKNEYSENNGYGVTNPNAISDGDNKGKGQAGDDGTIGNTSDINTRKANLVKNPTYGPNKKKYPDFI